MAELDFLPPEARNAAERMGDRLCEIRLRRNRPIQLVDISGACASLASPSQELFSDMAARLMGYSMYARENELTEGFITLRDGSRAGISGAFTGRNRSIGDISDISSVCIRIARATPGCADGVMEGVRGAMGLIIVSRPGVGKTTLLRDIVRRLSEEGLNISLMDERGELAACREGVPMLDVGPCTDVYSLRPKAEAMHLAVRAMAPDVIAVDEIGDGADAAAVREAARCGIRVIATAHGSGLSCGELRKDVARLISDGIFDTGILMGKGRGEIAQIKRLQKGGVI